MENSQSGQPQAANEKEVLISVSGSDAAGGEIVLTTVGTLAELPDGWLVSYDEIHPDDLASTSTTMECRTDGVTVLREGDVVSTIVYRKGETFVGDYQTALGAFELRVFTTEVHVKRRGNMGHIHLGYQISLSSGMSPGGEMAMRWLDVRFRPCRR